MTQPTKQPSAQLLVLYIITKADIGGAQNHLLALVEAQARVSKVVVLVGEQGYLTDQLQTCLPNVECTVVPNLKRVINPLHDFKAVREIRALLKYHQPDIVHLHSSKAGVVGRLAAINLDSKCVFTAHGWAFTEGAPKHRRAYGWLLETLLAPLADGIITVSEYDYKLAKRLCVGKASQRTLIKNCVADFGMPETPVSTGKQLITVGRVSTVKNMCLMVQALAQLSDKSIVLTIVGDGYGMHKLKQCIDEYQLKDRVHLVGERIRARRFLHQADAFILSSNYEGLPLSVLEAMSCGLPIIATNVGGVKEAVEHNVNGLLVPAKDSNALAKAMARLCAEPETRLSMAKASRKKYTANFQLAEMVRATQAVYQRLIV